MLEKDSSEFNSPLILIRSGESSQSDGRGDATRGTLPTPKELDSYSSPIGSEPGLDPKGQHSPSTYSPSAPSINTFRDPLPLQLAPDSNEYNGLIPIDIRPCRIEWPYNDPGKGGQPSDSACWSSG